MRSIRNTSVWRIRSTARFGNQSVLRLRLAIRLVLTSRRWVLFSPSQRLALAANMTGKTLVMYISSTWSMCRMHVALKTNGLSMLCLSGCRCMNAVFLVRQLDWNNKRGGSDDVELYYEIPNTGVVSVADPRVKTHIQTSGSSLTFPISHSYPRPKNIPS